MTAYSFSNGTNGCSDVPALLTKTSRPFGSNSDTSATASLIEIVSRTSNLTKSILPFGELFTSSVRPLTAVSRAVAMTWFSGFLSLK
jgi:hypothetical protein